MKMKWLVADVTTVGPPDRAERAILGVILAEQFFSPIRAVYVIKEPLCDVASPFRALIRVLRVI